MRQPELSFGNNGLLIFEITFSHVWLKECIKVVVLYDAAVQSI